MSKLVACLIILEAVALAHAALVSPLPSTDLIPGSIPPKRGLRKPENQTTRKRRCLGSVISLLWPQVVGPVDQGVIVEQGYDEVPKTLLEYRLDRIRQKAKAEERSRLMVREFMQKNLRGFNHFDFPHFHSNRFSFFRLMDHYPVFAHLSPERHLLMFH